jgi:hypothetical protein
VEEETETESGTRTGSSTSFDAGLSETDSAKTLSEVELELALEATGTVEIRPAISKALRLDDNNFFTDMLFPQDVFTKDSDLTAS